MARQVHAVESDLARLNLNSEIAPPCLAIMQRAAVRVGDKRTAYLSKDRHGGSGGLLE